MQKGDFLQKLIFWNLLKDASGEQLEYIIMIIALLTKIYDITDRNFTKEFRYEKLSCYHTAHYKDLKPILTRQNVSAIARVHIVYLSWFLN